MTNPGRRSAIYPIAQTHANGKANILVSNPSCGEAAHSCLAAKCLAKRNQPSPQLPPEIAGNTRVITSCALDAPVHEPSNEGSVKAPCPAPSRSEKALRSLLALEFSRS